MGEGLMIRRRFVRAVLWLVTFQLAFLPSKQQNSPGYLGCFGDARDRALSVGPAVELKKMSVEWCFRNCLEPTEYKYAGLEFGKECWCGDNEDYDKHGKKPESDCSDRCTGNSDQICGDSWRLSMYRVHTTQTTLQSIVTDSLMTIGNSKTDYISETPTNNPNTGALQTGAIVGIAVGAGMLTALILLVILLCKKRRKPKKKRPDVTVATIGDRYTHNAYALPEIVSQSITDQSTMPVYCRVIKDRTDSDDVYATPDDITSPRGDGNAPSDQAKGVTASRENGWVENTLYACESFPAEPATRVKYSDGRTNSGPPLKMEGKPGWVENNIYE